MSSKSEARRLILQNGIMVNSKIANNELSIKRFDLEDGIILRKGKKTFFKIKFEPIGPKK